MRNFLGLKKRQPAEVQPGQRISIQTPADARIEQLTKQLTALRTAHDDLQTRYNLLFALNQSQANTIEQLRGEISALGGEHFYAQ